MAAGAVLVEDRLDVVRERQELSADFTVRVRDGGNIDVESGRLEAVHLRGRQRSGSIRDGPDAAARGRLGESNDKAAVASHRAVADIDRGICYIGNGHRAGQPVRCYIQLHGRRARSGRLDRRGRNYLLVVQKSTASYKG